MNVSQLGLCAKFIYQFSYDNLRGDKLCVHHYYVYATLALRVKGTDK